MALKRTRYTFATEDTEQTVTVTQIDRIRLGRLMEELGIKFADMTVAEYETRLAFIAGMRVGIVSEPDFETWAATVEAVESTPDDVVSPGEPGATPAS